MALEIAMIDDFICGLYVSLVIEIEQESHDL